MTFYNLTLLDSRSPFEIYENISKSKHKYRDILVGIKDTRSKVYTNSPTYNVVKKCYETYEMYKENLGEVAPYRHFGNDEKEALLHCYNVSTKAVRDLKTNIIENQNIYYKTKCAYCGLGDNNNMDHYLPKDLFPEYSVHMYNLIPCCSYCNEKKSALFLDAQKNREIFNPYFDKLNIKLILECRIHCNESSIETTLLLHNGVDQVCMNHLSKLDIINRYKKELPGKISNIMYDLIVIADEYGENIEKSKKVMKRKLEEYERIQGHNSLDALIYRAYLNVDKLFEIDYLRKIHKTITREKIQSS